MGSGYTFSNYYAYICNIINVYIPIIPTLTSYIYSYFCNYIPTLQSILSLSLGLFWSTIIVGPNQV